jgi:hypothetical protein
MGREFHVFPSIKEAYYVVEDQRILRAEGFGEKGCGKEERKKSPIETAFKGLPSDWK